MEVSEKEWVNSENRRGDWIIAYHTTLALLVLRVNPLFFGGLQMQWSNLISKENLHLLIIYFGFFLVLKKRFVILIKNMKT